MKKFYAKIKMKQKQISLEFLQNAILKNLLIQSTLPEVLPYLHTPACCWALNMENFIKELVDLGLDGIEVYYPYPRWRKYIKFSNPDKLEAIADKYNLIKTGGTDCHGENL